MDQVRAKHAAPRGARYRPRMLLVETLAVGPLQCNCSILACADTREAVVVDPGGDPEKIMAIVKDFDLTVVAAVHTHAHLDHILATRDVKEETGASIGLHEGDRFLYEGVHVQAAMFGWKVKDTLAVDRWLVDGDAVEFGKRSLSVMHTPGHTPGSLSFVLDHAGGDDKPLVLAGDTLFQRSIGRTDLPGGDHATIERSIRDRLYALPPETRVVCGHGPDTSICDERMKNPFVRA